MVKVFFGLSTLFFFLYIFCCCIQSYDLTGLWIILWLLCLIIAIAAAIYKATKATVEAVGNGIRFIGDLVETVVSVIIDLLTIKDEVRQKVPNAFKILIQKKKANAVNVGIFDKQNTPICPMNIEGSGVQDELHVGQTIYLYN